MFGYSCESFDFQKTDEQLPNVRKVTGKKCINVYTYKKDSNKFNAPTLEESNKKLLLGVASLRSRVSSEKIHPKQKFSITFSEN